MTAAAYSADRSLPAKLRRRWARLVGRRPVRARFAGPMVSFSFDDAPETAVREGAAILEAAGARGTFYVSAGLAGGDSPSGRIADPEAFGALGEAGHEIGCHTFSHLDCGQAETEAALDDVARNRAAFAAWGAGEPTTFAYPYGDVAPRTKRALGSRFAALRALHKGLVEPGSDLNQLPAVGIEGRDGEAVAARWLERAAARSGWLILYTHDVAPEPSAWGCTPDALRRLVERARALGCEIVTVAEGVRRAGAA